MDPLSLNIEKETIDNTYYRRVLHTTPYNQVVLMSIPVGSLIPEEKHEHITQFIRIEKGKGMALIAGKNYNLEDGIALNIPPNTFHKIVNTGDVPLQLYSIYSPPEHPDKLIQKLPDHKIKLTPKEINFLIFYQNHVF